MLKNEHFNIHGFKIGGDEGTRTPVHDNSNNTFYMLSLFKNL